ncbi:hypothetical protein O0L34_g18509 [Tuta absoluta]|nr:hypothetical protein O0L34_g18509 [Tuta absoluta]
MEKKIFLVVAIVNLFFVCAGSDKSEDNYKSDSSESSEIEPVQLKVLGENTKEKPNLTSLLAEERCKHHVEIGYCIKNIPRWAFSRGDCYEFEYSGCGGNLNNFHSRESCLHHCGSLINKGGKVPLSTGSFIISFEESEEVEPPSRRMQCRGSPAVSLCLFC